MTVVERQPYSALPHAVLFDPRLSSAAIVLYAVLQSHWWQSGECYASHATLAAEMRCSDSQLRRYLAELRATEHVVARRCGRGQAKAYAPANPTTSDGRTVPQPLTHEQLNRSPMNGSEESNRPPVSGSDDPNRSPMNGSDSSNRSPMNGSEEPNRSLVTPQPFTGDDLNRSPMTDSYKKIPEKKIEEDRGTAADAAVAAPAAKAKTTRVAFASLSEDARRVVDDWRQKMGKARPPSLNPTQAAYLEDAVVDLGVERLLEANTWAATNAVPEIVKAVRAARTRRQREEGDGLLPAPPSNGTAPKPSPLTDEDWEIWGRALADLGAMVNAANFAAYYQRLELAGRGPDGGLWLVVPRGIEEMVARARGHIVRALHDAGDPAPTAVAFKIRRA